jgi:hypothetical protein
MVPNSDLLRSTSISPSFQNDYPDAYIHYFVVDLHICKDNFQFTPDQSKHPVDFSSCHAMAATGATMITAEPISLPHLPISGLARVAGYPFCFGPSPYQTSFGRCVYPSARPSLDSCGLQETGTPFAKSRLAIKHTTFGKYLRVCRRRYFRGFN